MTTLKKLKLNALSQSELEKRSMGEIVGGYNCSCGCMGTSSTEDNKNANIKNGQTTPGYSKCDSWLESITVTWK